MIIRLIVLLTVIRIILFFVDVSKFNQFTFITAYMVFETVGMLIYSIIVLVNWIITGCFELNPIYWK
jgi:hypothetical protein